MALLIYLIFRDRRNSEYITEKCVISLLGFISTITEHAAAAKQAAEGPDNQVL